MPQPGIIFIVGPTGVGKTETAIYLAKKIKAEIISCDSMQVYKGMDIISSKPTPKQLAAVPHHLISAVSPKISYNASQYRKDALKKIGSIIGRGKIPLFVGGTGMYMTVLVDGIFDLDIQDLRLRNRLQSLALKKGSGYLHSKLMKIDPAAAHKIHPNDTRRIIRALEVHKITGKRISDLQKTRHGLKDDHEVRIFCLNMRRDKLYERIDARVEKMFKQGLVKEVEALLKKELGKTAGCAIGINELKGHFSGAYGLDIAKYFIKRNTRHYAKRQLTWFRKDRRIEWVNIRATDKPKEIANKLWKKLY